MRANMLTVRVKLLASLAAVLLPGLPAVAGPLDPPPPDTVRAWIIEWAGGTTPRLQGGEITYTFGRSGAVLAVIPFDVIGGRRELHAGYWASFVAAKDQGVYPSVWHDGRQKTPPCPVTVACEHPDSRTMTKSLDGNVPGRRSYYVIALNDDVLKITTSPGWKPPRELKQPLRVQIVQPDGTGARVSWVAGVEHFTGATAPGGRYGSFAFSWIPCAGRPWDGWGSIVLHGGDPDTKRLRGDTRRAQCDPYSPVALGTANGLTTWQVEGEVTSTSSDHPNRLVVVDLPRFPS